jgi:hypothetical protein
VAVSIPFIKEPYSLLGTVYYRKYFTHFPSLSSFCSQCTNVALIWSEVRTLAPFNVSYDIVNRFSFCWRFMNVESKNVSTRVS